PALHQPRRSARGPGLRISAWLGRALDPGDAHRAGPDVYAHDRSDRAGDDLRAGHFRLQGRHELVDVDRPGMQHADRFDIARGDSIEDEIERLRTGPDLAGLL